MQQCSFIQMHSYLLFVCVCFLTNDSHIRSASLCFCSLFILAVCLILFASSLFRVQYFFLVLPAPNLTKLYNIIMRSRNKSNAMLLILHEIVLPKKQHENQQQYAQQLTLQRRLDSYNCFVAVARVIFSSFSFLIRIHCK